MSLKIKSASQFYTALAMESNKFVARQIGYFVHP